ncbi:MAG: ComF family protein [Patescibacteria group bacterium]
MSPTIKKAKEILLDIFFPEICAACRNPLGKDAKDLGICLACLEAAEVKTAFTCPVCGARFAEGVKTCHVSASYRLAAASNYENDIVKGLIRELKYSRRTAYGRPLAALIAAHLKNVGFDLSDYALLPMPLHPARERERGFNQSAVITEFLSEMTGMKIAPKDTLLRIRNTPSQAELTREARLTNMAGSFSVKPGARMPKHIILLDDVFTSGATVGAAVSALRSGGAQHVIAVVAAKA